MIKILLIFGVLVVFGWFLINPKSRSLHAWIKILMLLLAALAIIVIAFPQTANSLAHSVGVGRGADLLLYTLSISFIFATLSAYVKNKDQQSQITELVRKIALIEARRQDKRK